MAGQQLHGWRVGLARHVQIHFGGPALHVEGRGNRPRFVLVQGLDGGVSSLARSRPQKCNDYNRGGNV